MANLKEIRSRIKSVKSTQQITKAMKMVSAAKLRRAQDNITQLRPYASKLQELIGRLSASQEEAISEFAAERPAEKILIVVVTSNRGLCGAFNTNVIRLTNTLIEEKYARQFREGKVSILAVGKKGYEFFLRKKYSLVGQNFDLFSSLTFSSVSEVANLVMQGFVEGKWDRVELVYNEFKNVATQNRIVQQFLPVSSQEETPQTKGSTKSKSVDYIFEPDQETILKDLIPKSLRIQFLKAVFESNAAEHGARMTAMDKASENANELLGKLKLFYNRARQATITNEILEIVGGANALASQ